MRAALCLVLAGALSAPALAQPQPRELGEPPAAAAPPPARPAPPPQSPPAQAAPSGNVWQTIETTNFGQWTYTALRHATNGTASCALHTHWHQTNRQLRIVALEQPITMNLALTDPSWNMREGATARGSIAIDGNTFTAEFERIGQSVLNTRLAAGSDAVRRFMQSFRAGNTMRVTLPGDSFTAGLRGSAAAMDAMVRCMDRHFGAPRAPAAPVAPGTKG